MKLLGVYNYLTRLIKPSESLYREKTQNKASKNEKMAWNKPINAFIWPELRVVSLQDLSKRIFTQCKDSFVYNRVKYFAEQYNNSTGSSKKTDANQMLFALVNTVSFEWLKINVTDVNIW